MQAFHDDRARSYVGYSAVLFSDAVRAHGGKHYLSIEQNPEMAAVANQLVDLAGLRDHVRIIVGSSNGKLSFRRKFFSICTVLRVVRLVVRVICSLDMSNSSNLSKE